MNCPNCHSPVADGAVFCTNCGAKLPAAAPNQPQNPPQSPINAPYNARQPVQNHYGYSNPAGFRYSSGNAPYGLDRQSASMPCRWSGGVIALGVIGFLLALASAIMQMSIARGYRFGLKFDAEFYIFMIGMPMLAMLLFVIPTKKIAILTAIPFAAVIVRFLVYVIPELDRMETMPILFCISITAALIVYLIAASLGRKSQYWLAILFFLLAVPVTVWQLVEDVTNYVDYLDYFDTVNDSSLKTYFLSGLVFELSDLLFALARTAALFSLANSARKLRR